MGLYKLTGVKIDREENGKRVSYKIGDNIEMTDEQAEAYAWGIEPASQNAKAKQSGTPMALVPDSDEDTSDIDPKIAAVVSGNVDQVLAYINDHSDDDDTLEALRTAEKGDKKRKTVLDAIDNLLQG